MKESGLSGRDTHVGDPSFDKATAPSHLKQHTTHRVTIFLPSTVQSVTGRRFSVDSEKMRHLLQSRERTISRLSTNSMSVIWATRLGPGVQPVVVVYYTISISSAGCVAGETGTCVIIVEGSSRRGEKADDDAVRRDGCCIIF